MAVLLDRLLDLLESLLYLQQLPSVVDSRGVWHQYEFVHCKMH